ncbi:MAG: SCO family protein [Candidatus Heimdallarchaeota archaeon]
MISSRSLTLSIGVIALILISGTLFIILTYKEPLADLGLAADFNLLDENNQTVTFVTYNSGERVVVVDFIYTSCPDLTMCPLSSSMLKGVQSALLDRGFTGLDFHLLSISFDWLNDGLDDMKNYSQKYGADPSVWSFLWGNESQIAHVTSAYGIFAGYPNITSSLVSAADRGYNLAEIHGISHENHSVMIHNMGLSIIDGFGHVRAKHTSVDWTVDLVVDQVVRLIQETGGA